MNGPRLRRRTLLMIWDGLRPDFVTPQHTPRLSRLAGCGVRFLDAHAVFPTVTRCNSASIATGLLPAGHGMPGNSFVLPADAAGRRLVSANAAHLEELRSARAGRVLLAPTLAERVTAAGGVAAVVGSGSPGSALLQHPQARELGDRVYNHSLWIGTSQRELERLLGPMPDGALPNSDQDQWFTRLITDHLLAERRADLVVYWHTDPDRTQHDHGVGHPVTMRAVRAADDHLGAILDALDRLGMADETNVIVTSDHGFSTIGRRLDLSGALVDAGVKASRESTDVVVTDASIYVREGGAKRRESVVAALQEMEDMGCLFTGARKEPVVGGTLPMADIGHGGELAPSVLLSLAWEDTPNEHGFPGMRAATSPKAADHGAISPWEIRSTLIAAGPDFKQGLDDPLPAGNIDITPTALELMGLDGAAALDGRVWREALRAGPDPAALPVRREVRSAGAGSYRQEIALAHVDGTGYLDSGVASR